MKKTYSVIGLVLLGVAVTTVAGVLCEIRKRRSHHRLSAASDEGYETAHDIIYPDKFTSRNDKKLRYGPVF
ncbi:hypothetical protein [Niabella aquatica]